MSGLGRILLFLLMPKRGAELEQLLGVSAAYKVPRQTSDPADAHQPCPSLNGVNVAWRCPVDDHREQQPGNGAKTRQW
jgi:hypothetical protein